MNTKEIIINLQQQGWKNIKTNDSYYNHQFDIIAMRRHLLFVQWFAFIKYIPTLDEQQLQKELKIFSEINQKSKSIWIGKLFVFVIITSKMNQKLASKIKGDSFPMQINAYYTQSGSSPRMNLFVGRINGGGGNLLVFDEKKKQWYGEIPNYPLDVKKYSLQMQEIIQ